MLVFAVGVVRTISSLEISYTNCWPSYPAKPICTTRH